MAKWLLDPFVSTKGGTLLIGEIKEVKHWIAHAMLLSITSGKPFLGWPEGEAVLGHCLEAEHRIRNVQDAVLRLCKGVSMDETEAKICYIDKGHYLAKSMQAFAKRLTKEESKFALLSGHNVAMAIEPNFYHSLFAFAQAARHLEIPWVGPGFITGLLNPHWTLMQAQHIDECADNIWYVDADPSGTSLEMPFVLTCLKSSGGCQGMRLRSKVWVEKAAQPHLSPVHIDSLENI